jgi:hypothetical protein
MSSLIGSAEWLHERREKSGYNEAVAFLDRMKFKGKKRETAFELYTLSKNWHILDKEQAEAYFQAAVKKHGSVNKALKATKENIFGSPPKITSRKNEEMTARKFLEKIKSEST